MSKALWIQPVKMKYSLKPNIHDLYQAASCGSEELVQEILDQDCVDVNGTVCGSTILSLTLYQEKKSLFSLLIKHKLAGSKLDLNKLSKDEKQRVEPPLVTACRLGNREAVWLLIKHGADLNKTDNFQHNSLWMATRQRYTDLVDCLINSGAMVTPSRVWTHSPLFFAVKYSSKRNEIAKILILGGADINMTSGPLSEHSLLYCAIVQGDIPIANLIIEAGYNVSSDKKIRIEYNSGSLTRNTDLNETLEKELTVPQYLQKQCRTAIRGAVSAAQKGRFFQKSVAQLPLPKSIIDYITLK